MAFNFQARVQLTGPYNVQQVAQQISRQLSNVQAKVNLQVSSAGLQQIGQINSALYGFSGAAKRAGADIKALNNDMYNFGEQAGLATRRFLAFTLAAGAITGIVIGFKNGISSAIQFQRELVRFDQISGDTRATIKGVADEVTRLATTFGVSSKELIQSATILRQAGLSALETKTALEALSLAALSPNFGKFSENVEGAIAVMRQFNVGSEQLTQAFGSINAVAGDYAVEAKDIIDATIRAGGAFATLGGNLNEFLAIFTTVRATTRESADTIATGLRTIFARLQQSDTVDALKDLQINLRHTGEEAARLGNVNLTNQFVGPYEAIRRLSEGLKDLPSTDPRFAAVVEQIGGIRQISRVLPLLQQDKLRESVLRTASLGTGSLLPGAEKAQEALLNRVDKTREGFEKLFRTIAADTGFQNLIKVGLSAADMFAKIAEYAVPLVPVLAAFGISRAVSSASQFGQGAIDKFRNDKSKPYYNVRGFATGDVVPGSGNTDSVAANLMPGEFVFRKQAVQDIGIDNLRSLHQKAHIGAGVRHFAQGSNESVRRNRLLRPDELDPSYRKAEELAPLVSRLSSIYPNQPQSTSLLKRVRGGIDSTADYIKENLISTLVASVPLGIGAAAGSNNLLSGIFNGIGGFAASAAGIGAAGAVVTSGKAPDILGNTIKGIGSGIKGLAKKGFGAAYNFGAAGQNLDTGSSNDFLNELLGTKPTGNYALAEKNKREIGLLANFFDGAFPTIGVLDWNQTDLNNNPHLREFAYKNPGVFQNKASIIRKQLKRGGELGLNTSGKLNELDNVLKDFYKMYAKREPYVAQLAQEPYLAQLASDVPTAELTPYTADTLPGKRKRGARDANINAAYNYLDFNRGDTAGAIRYLQESTGLKESTAKRYVRTALNRLGSSAKNIGTPPVKPGFVRMYHGGSELKGDDERDVTQYLDYAKGYAAKNPNSNVYYIDLPESHPSLSKSYDDTGTDNKSPYVNTLLNKELSKKLKLFKEPKKFAEGGLLGGNIGAALKKLTAVNKNNFAAVLAGLGVRFGGTNDDYVMEALLKAKRKEGEAIVSNYKPKGYSQGGLREEVPSLLENLQAKTGLKLSKLFRKITFNNDNFGYGDKALGVFSNQDKAINLNIDKIPDSEKLGRVLSHEVGHSLDYTNKSGRHSKVNEELKGALLSLNPSSSHPAYQKDSALLRETFAETFRSMMGYGKLEDSKHIQFGSPEKLNQATKEIQKILERARSKVSSPKKFALGGENVGATDVVPAALTPGEFIFSREATTRIGVANLHRANKSGDISHMAGLTGFHKGGHVGRLNLATGSDRPVERKNILDEVIRGGGTTSTFNVNKQQQYLDARVAQLQKEAQAQGQDINATVALAKAKIELANILKIAQDQTNRDLREKQKVYAATISGPKFDVNDPKNAGYLKSFDYLNKTVDPLLAATAFNQIDGGVVGTGKFADPNLAPSPGRSTVKQLRKLPLADKYFNTAGPGSTDTTIAQLLSQTSPTGGGNYTQNSIQNSLQNVLKKQYEEEAKARGLYITQTQLETKARAEATRLINLSLSKEYAQATKTVDTTSKIIDQPNFNKFSIKQQEAVFEKRAKALKIVENVDSQTALAFKGNRTNITSVGDYKLAPRPTLQRDLTGPASSIKPVSELFTSPRDNGFIQKITNTGSYNTSLTNLLAAGQTKDTLRPQLESAIQAQLKREYEESGKAIAASELITRSKIGANKLLEVASSKEVQVVNRRVQFYEKLIQSPAFSGRSEESRNKIESAYNVYKTRQNELQELTSVRTQNGQITGRGGVPNDQSALARRENFTNKVLLGSQIFLPLIGSAVDSATGDAENNLNSGGRYRAGRTAGGALQGAAVGATAGSILGAPGAVIGGILGTLVGGVNAFVEAGNELRKAKLGEALTTLALNINAAQIDLERQGRLSQPSREAAQDTLNESLSLLKPENTTQRAIGQSLGSQRNIGQALNTLLEDDIRAIIRDNPNLKPADIQQRLEKDRKQNVTFENGITIQANRYQLLALTNTRNADSSAQRVNTTQVIDSLIRSLAAENIARETSRIAHAFGLLSGYIDKASGSFEKIESSIESSLNILSGRGGPERLRLSSDVSSVNPFSQTFGQNFNEQLSPFGRVGSQIGARANELQSFAQVLPEVLNEIVANGQVNAQSFRSSVSSRIPGYAGSQFSTLAGSAFAELTQSGKTSKEELQSGLLEKLGQQFRSIVPSLERIVNLTNQYAATLNEAAKAQNEAIKFNLQANQASLDVERINAQIAAVRAGRSDGGSFLNRESVNRPFNNNISQLLQGSPFAGQNPNNLNIQAIGEAFQRTITESANIRNPLLSNSPLAQAIPGTSSIGPAVPNAAIQTSKVLNQLAEQGNRYRQVLEAYTNVTARASRANEDLSQIRGDRQGRQNLAARFIGGDASQQSEILRGLQVVQGLRNTPGGLNGVGRENAGLAISTLQSLGGTRLNINGERIPADQYLQQELERANPGTFADVNREEIAALTTLADVNKQAQAAYSALGDANKIFSDKAKEWAVDIFNRNSETLGTAAERLNQIASPAQRQTRPDNPALYGPLLGIEPPPGGPRAGLGVIAPRITSPPSFMDALNRTGQYENIPRSTRGYADGGNVFKPQGTDIVPAMLTPGEFIVNAQSTRANYSLLKQINDSRRPIYRQNGGLTARNLISDFGNMPIPRPPQRFISNFREMPFPKPPEKTPLRLARGPYDSPAELFNNSLNGDRDAFAYYQQANSRNLQGAQIASFLSESSNPFDRILYGNQQRSYQQRITEAAANFRNLRRPNAEEVGDIRRLNLPPINQPFENRIDNPRNPLSRLRDGGVNPNRHLIPGFNQDLQGQGPVIPGFGQGPRSILNPDELSRRSALNRGLINRQPWSRVPFRPFGFADGGFVGSDTVPAMLTPGEFVVNSTATANNIPLLNHINNTRSPLYRANGGLIGTSPGSSSSNAGTGFDSGLTQALTGFNESSKSLATALQSFAGTANELAASIARFPTKMEVSVTHNVNVNHNGAQAFATMEKQLTSLVIGETTSRLQDTFSKAFPDTNISFTGASIK